MTTVISVENVSKAYSLGMIGGGTLKDDLSRWWARFRGKPDPFSKIGQEQHAHRIGEQFWALQDVSFEVKEGEVLGIIGRNGAGKSTLLKILSQVTTPTSGQIKVKGRIASLLEVGTGFHVELTGRENIFLNGAILGMSKAEIRRKLDEIVAFSGIQEFIDTPVKRYSSGMYVRLAFAVAAHLEPEILVVDEVLAVGDAAFQKKCLGKMGDVAKKGRTVLFVSHNMGAVNQLCPTSVWLDTGRIKRLGPSASVISSYLAGEASAIKTGETLFPRNPHKMAQVCRIRLIDGSGRVASFFNCDEPITIEVLFEVFKRVPGMYCWLDLSRSDGTVVLMSDSFDSPPNPLDDLAVGLHEIRIVIPSRTLGHGEYNVTLQFTGMLGGATPVDEREDVCSFTLNDFTSARGDTRPGYLSALPRWEVRPVSPESFANLENVSPTPS